MPGSGEAAVALHSRALFAKLKPGPGRPAAEVADHQRARIHSAMIEAVAEHGYHGVTMRTLAGLAGVSSRAFYKHYAGKEECFLRTHDLVVRKVARHMVLAQADSEDWRECLRLTVDAFLDEVAREPRAAHLFLVDVFAAGAPGQAQALQANRTFEALYVEAFGRDSARLEIPPPLTGGIVAGIAAVARARLVAGEEGSLPSLAGPLAEWAASLYVESAKKAAAFDRLRGYAAAGSPGSSSKPGRRALVPDGNRALLLTATRKLVAKEGYESLTVQGICAAAGAPRRRFDANFESVEECFVATFEHEATRALEDVAVLAASAPAPPVGLCRAIAALCERIASDPAFAGLCFDKIFTPGEAGVASRGRIAERIAERLGVLEPEANPVDSLAVEASVGAAWGLLHRCVAADRARQAPRLAAPLAFLLLTPQVGDRAALLAIARATSQASDRR